MSVGEIYRKAKLPKAKTVIVVLAVGSGWWLTWPPDQRALGDSCRPDGILSAASEGLYGKIFWRGQFDAFQRARIYEEGEPARRAAWYKNLERISQEAREVAARAQQDLYAKHPQLERKKSSAEREAEALRAEADRIEEAERRQSREQLFDDAHRKRFEWLSRCERLAGQHAERA